MPFDYERHLDNRMARRVASENRALDRRERLEKEAEKLVGQLMKDGKTVYYINQRNMKGTLTGKIREFTREGEAISFLIRNHYV